MTPLPLDRLTDADLIARTKHAVCVERQSTVELISLLAELDARRLYLPEGCASMFTYCTQVLGLSESAAYARITAARTVRRLPAVLNVLATGDITLTTINLLSAHLTEANHEALLDAAKSKCKRDVERLVASLVSQPDIVATVRKLPSVSPPSPQTQPHAPIREGTIVTPAPESAPLATKAQGKPSVVAPL